jgi:hypothetical protein
LAAPIAINDDRSGSGSGGAIPVRVLAVAFDDTAKRMIYLCHYPPPRDTRAHDAWVPAADFGVTDAVLQRSIRRFQKDTLPLVFDRYFHGGPELDHDAPIPADAVFREVDTNAEEGGAAFVPPVRAFKDDDHRGGNDAAVVLPAPPSDSSCPV